MGLAIKKEHRYWSINRLTREEQESVSSSITQTWTDQALKCYLIEANCDTCSIPKGNYSFTCQMHKVVPVLLESLGEPEETRIEKLMPFLHE